MNTPTNTSELGVWEWLSKILDYLGTNGMSTEESEEENHHTVFQVKIMYWRRDVGKYLNLIDAQQHKVSGLFSNARSKGVGKCWG